MQADCDAVPSLQGGFAYCQAIVRERLERLVGQGDAQGGPIGSERDLRARGRPPSGSVYPNSES